MFASMLQVESIKLFRRKILWIEGIIIAALIALILVTLVGVSSMPDIPAEAEAEVSGALLWPAGIMMGGSMAASNQMGALMILVLVSALITQEYGWGTLALLLSRGVSRRAAFFSKLTVIVLAAFVLALISVALGTAASAAFTMFAGQPFVLQSSDFVLMLGMLVGTVLSLLPYIGLTVLLSVLSRSAVTSIGVGIGFLIAEGLIGQIFGAIGGIFAQIALYFPMSVGQQFFSHVFAGAETAGMLSMPVAAMLLVAYGAIFSALALWRFLKQDLTA